MKYKIITDSTSDVTKEFAEKYDVSILPLQVIFEGTAYKAGVDITTEDFYVRLRECLAEGKALPTTSQISEEEFKDEFELYANKPDVTVIVLLIAKEMSGTYSSALRAVKELGMTNVIIPDSRQVTFSLGAIVAEAAKFAQTEPTVEEMTAKIDDLIDRVQIYASIGDLRCLRAGGRLSALAMTLGTMLKLKPIIEIRDKVDVVAKVISQGKATRWIVDKVAEERDDTLPIYFGSSEAPQILDEFRTKFKDVLRLSGDEEEFPLGPVVGVHAGPGCAGIAFFKKK
ncbi:MAG: DegV family protein [Clostridia bacterium]|nr:DegV family protein [Clostridia bacterium]